MGATEGNMDANAEATRITRDVRIGDRTHRLSVVLEGERFGGRYYVDDVPVDPDEFDRVVAIATMSDPK